MRIVHLGLGAFHRAHEAWYTQRANEAGGDWGIAAFSGRSPRAARILSEQDAVYTLVERGAETDRPELIESISAAYDGADVANWRRLLADPAVVILSLTVTEAGYAGPGDPVVDADIVLLRADGAAGATSAAGRIVDGLRARRRADAGPIAIVSCDNVAGNGAVTRAAVLAVADAVDPGLSAWIRANASFVSTMVDRITPTTVEADRESVRSLTGFADAAPVVTEPHSEWILSGDFPAGRPEWERAGARFVSDVEPFERRKLWLLNGGHTLLAYLGLARGHETVADAFGDPACRRELEELWAESAEVLPFERGEIDAATRLLAERFSNARIRHRLAQIAVDGAHKLPPRIVDPLRARVDSGLQPGRAQAGVLAAWAESLAVRPDASASALAERLARADPDDSRGRADAVVAFLAPDLASDHRVAEAVADRIASIHEHQPHRGDN